MDEGTTGGKRGVIGDDSGVGALYLLKESDVGACGWMGVAKGIIIIHKFHSSCIFNCPFNISSEGE